MSAFVLQIHDLDEVGRDWSFSIRPDWLATALADTELKPGNEAGELRVHAQRSALEVLVRGTLRAGLAATCARCLSDVPVDVDLPVTALFSPEHMRPEGVEEVSVDPDEVSRDYYGGSEVVLDSMVRELLLLEAPMKPLCSESCEGIAMPAHVRPPEDLFGEGAPDARLAPLLKLKEAMTKTKNEE